MRVVRVAATTLVAAAVFLLLLLGSGILPYQTFVVQNGSMSPTIPQKSLVLVHKSHYDSGQVITFRKKGIVVTHRAIRINDGGTITTKGDANTTPDADPLSPDQVIGGVVAAPPLLGWLMVYLRSPAGMASVLLLVIVFAIWGHSRTLHENTSPA